MRTTITILLLALICVGSFARDNYGQNRRHFRPSRYDYTDNPSGDDNADNSWNNEPENNDNSWDNQPEENEENEENEEDEESWDDNRQDDEQSWRPKHSRKQHNHRVNARDQTEDTNTEDSNVESNVQPSKADTSNTHKSHNRASNTQPSNTESSNTQSLEAQPSNTQPSSASSSTSGHLNSDTFASTDYNDDTQFKQQCLDIHNDERASLGIDPVTYNDDLAAAAKVWAEQLVQAGQLSHSTNRVHVGENVGYRTHNDDVDSTPLLIGAWLAEKKDFENGDYPDISTTGSPHDVGHYSQMIWGTTKEIGCAVVNGDDRDYMCCQYAPSGNRQGEPVY